MATQTITMDANKTVKVTGLTFKVTPTITNASVTLNGTALTSGTPVTITKDSTLVITGTAPDRVLTLEYENTSEPVVSNTAT